jgi:hypothetical protein
MSEMGLVAGGGDNCPSGDSGGNNYGGITDTKSIGDELIEIYEGLVAATSHIIERVAGAL